MTSTFAYHRTMGDVDHRSEQLWRRIMAAIGAVEQRTGKALTRIVLTRELGIPKGTLANWMISGQHLPESHHPRVEQWLAANASTTPTESAHV